jgi:hypothetical protein
MSTNFKKKMTSRRPLEKHVQMRRALEKGCQGEVSSSGRRRAVEARRRCARGGRGRRGGEIWQLGHFPGLGGQGRMEVGIVLGGGMYRKMATEAR